MTLSRIGAHVTLFLVSIKRVARRTQYKLLCYVILLFVLATVGIALQITWTQIAFIQNRNYPGGSNQFLLDHVDSDMNRAVTAVYVAINWLADGIIVRTHPSQPIVQYPLMIILVLPLLYLVRERGRVREMAHSFHGCYSSSQCNRVDRYVANSPIKTPSANNLSC